jgi:monoamine oxidase
MDGPKQQSLPTLRKAGHRVGRDRSKGKRGKGAEGDGKDGAIDATLNATVDAGLKPGLLTMQGEKRAHAGDRSRYIKTRDYVLTEWARDRSRFLTRQACLENYAGEEEREYVEEVYSYLHMNACINVGILKNDPLVPIPAGIFGARESEGASVEDAVIPDESIQGTLYSLMEKINMDETSEKAIRDMLAQHFGSPMDSKLRKKLIKRLIAEYIECGGPPPSWKDARLKGKASQYAKIVVVGAGPAGLMAGLHLKRHGCDVTILEARNRVGGRIHSYIGDDDGGQEMGAACDLGASIITGRAVDGRKGLRADPSALLCEQLGLKLHDLNTGSLPIYDGRKEGVCSAGQGEGPRAVKEEIDSMAQTVMNELMDRAAAYCEKMPVDEQEKVSFGTLVDRARENWEAETAEKVRRKIARRERVSVHIALRVGSDGHVELDATMGDESFDSYSSDDDDFPPELLPKTLNAEHERLLHWNWANLEYGCSAPINLLSAPHWNEDEDFGGFGGPHSFVIGGYDQAFKQIANHLNVRMGMRVSEIEVDNERSKNSVIVVTEANEELACDAVLVTVPLGVLKRQAISFSPDLPQWKKDSIERLGFGKLDKVFLEFEDVFWDDSVDFFGAAKGTNEGDRGLCFMFWNIHRFSGKPILAALISGQAAHINEVTPEEQLKEVALDTLRSVFRDRVVPVPVAYHVTRWGTDVDTGGSYSFVAVGASMNDYEMLARPVGKRIFFAGEHTCQEHPDTVGGAMLTGLREASRILDMDARAEAPDIAINFLASRKRKSSANGTKRDEAEDRNEGALKMELDDVDMLEAVLPKDLADRVVRDNRGEEARIMNREVAKGMWKALMAAESGDTSYILDSVRFADENNQQAGIIRPLVEAGATTLLEVFKDSECLLILAEWVDEMVDQQSRTQDMLLLLKAFDVPDWNAIGRSKARDRLQLILAKVGQQHQDGGVKIAAKRVIQKIQNMDIFSDDDFIVSPVQKRTASKVGAAPKIDDETQRKLDEAEAELRAMQAEAERLRSQVETHATAAPVDEDSPAFGTFEEYRDSLRAKRKKPKAKMARVSSGRTAPIGDTQTGHASQDGPSARDAFRRRIDGCIAEALKPHYDARKISKETYKMILKKSSAKIMAKTTDKDINDWSQFIRSRKGMITKLVDSYVAISKR